MDGAREKHTMAGVLLCLALTGLSAAGQNLVSHDEHARAVPLVNAGFESDVLHEGWSLHVYGAPPELTLDADVRHEGGHSLRVKADNPSDTAFGQELRLKPGRWYRLRGWVRTERLDPRGSPTCGTFQVQTPGGASIVATGRNHAGTHDWVEEVLYFTPPADGLTRIAIFFVGFGKGTGTAWFDQIALAEIDVAISTLTVTQEPLCSGEISPFQYGQFIEYLCGLTLSMFAEKVSDGSFEGVPEYRVVFRKETDRIEQPWYPDGAVHRGEFEHDKIDPFNGGLSQRITQKPGDPCTLGISQNGIYVKKGEPLKCALSLRARNLRGPVQLTLWGRGKTYAATEFQPNTLWQRFESLITPSDTDDHATLTISFRGPGTICIDAVSLMPTNAVFGWRRDVAEAVKALRPGIIRFGGTATEGFEWTDTIGDPAKRVPFTTCWGGLEPGNAGLEEFVRLCEWVGAEPLICVRFSGKTPKDAADQVEYFNGAPTSPMGRRRADNGRVQPYGVKYWQIGNELGDESYQANVAAFCKAVKEVDPSVKVLAAYPSEGLLKSAAPYIDYICPHHYGCDQLQAMDQSVEDCRNLIATHAPGRNIRLGITEWNATAGDFGLGRARLWTLDNALTCSRYHNFMHRHCDMIEIANRSNLADSFCSGIIQTNKSGLFKTPTYYAEQLYATLAGQRPLKIGIDANLPYDPSLDISATLSSNGANLSIFAVNHTNESQRRNLDLKNLAPLAKKVNVWILADTAKAGERDAGNSWREPDRIRVVADETTLVDSRLGYEFPPLSLTVLLFFRNI
jgi:alpha-N-arabinofuranosidase